MSVMSNQRRLDLVVRQDRLYANPHGVPLSKDEWQELGLPFSGWLTTNFPVACIPREELLPGDRPVAAEGETHVLILFGSDVRQAEVELCR
jgi:hypothetical protein